MKTIHKYPIRTSDKQVVVTHKGFKPLYVNYDGKNRLCLWGVVNTDAKEIQAHIYVVGTGNPLPDVEMDYVGSVKDTTTNPEFAFIWHIFVGK